jgi:hypothetical protein
MGKSWIEVGRQGHLISENGDISAVRFLDTVAKRYNFLEFGSYGDLKYQETGILLDEAKSPLVLACS